MAVDELALPEIDMVTLDMTHDDVCEVREKILFLKSRLRELERQMNDDLIAWIKQHGDIEYGDTRLTVGVRKTTKCKALPVAVEAVLNSVNGDFNAFCEHLSVNALKPGACRNLLGPAFDNHFTTQKFDKIELKELNTKFLKG